MKILIVDDDINRAKALSVYLNSYCKCFIELIEIKTSANSGKKALRNTYFDVLILDVVLPLRDEPPSSEVGLAFLNEINISRSIRIPQKIIGITADIGEISIYKGEFEKSLNVVIEAGSTSFNWKSQLAKAIETGFRVKLSQSVDKSDLVCVTIHGIRTIGDWQGRLKSLIEIEVSRVSVFQFKYGYFQLFSFLIPSFRKWVVDRFTHDLEVFLTENWDKKVILFAHSFGTLVTIEAISQLSKKVSLASIQTVVLAGSVLKVDHDFSVILENSTLSIVNECGVDDSVLLLSEAFIPGTGMAGRVGFVGFQDRRVINRYHLGGHSLYFDKSSIFFKKFWLPCLIGGKLETVDPRFKKGIISRKVELAATFCGKVFYPFLVVAISYWVWAQFKP